MAPPRPSDQQSASSRGTMTREQQLAEWKRQRDAAAQRKQEKSQRPKTPTTPRTPPVQRARAVSTTTTPRSSSSRQTLAEQRRKTMTALSAKKGARDVAPSERRTEVRRQSASNAAAATAARTLTAEPLASSQQQIHVQQHEDHDAHDTVHDSQDPQDQETQGHDAFDPESSLRERYCGVEYDPERYKGEGEDVMMTSQYQQGIDAAGQHKSFDEDAGLDKANGPHVLDGYPLSNATSSSRRSPSSTSSSKASRSGSSSSSGSSSPLSRSNDGVEMPMAEDGNTHTVNHDERHDESVVGAHLDLSDVFDSDHDEELAMLDELVPMMESYVDAHDTFCAHKDEDFANDLEALDDDTDADRAANSEADASILFEVEASLIINEGEDASGVTESEHIMHAAATGESAAPDASELMESEYAENADDDEDSAAAAEPTSLAAQEQAFDENMESMVREADLHHVPASAIEESERATSPGDERENQHPLPEHEKLEHYERTSSSSTHQWRRLALVCVPVTGLLAAGFCWRIPSSNACSIVQQAIQDVLGWVVKMFDVVKAWVALVLSAVGIQGLWSRLNHWEASQKLTQALASLLSEWDSTKLKEFLKDTLKNCQSGFADFASHSSAQVQVFASDPLKHLNACLKKFWKDVQDIGATGWNGLESAWQYVFPSRTEEMHLDLLKSIREQFLKPLEEEQAVINGKIKELLMKQEAWALDQLKRMKTRRTAFSSATESILSETRDSVLQSLQNAKLDAVHQIETYTAKMSEELIQSIRRELDEYERAVLDEQQEETLLQLEKAKQDLEAMTAEELQELEKVKAEVDQQIEAELKVDEQRVLSTKEQGIAAVTEKARLEKQKIEAEFGRIADLVAKLAEEERGRLEDEHERAEKEIVKTAIDEEGVLFEEEMKLLEELEMLAELEQAKISAERDNALLEVEKAARLEEEKLRKEREEAEALAELLAIEEERLALERQKVEAEIAEAARLDHLRVEAARTKAEEEVFAARKREEDRVRLEIERAAEGLAKAKMEQEVRERLEYEKAEAAIAEAARTEEERIEVEEERLRAELDQETRLLQETLREKRKIAEAVLERMLEEEERQIETELLKGEVELQEAAAMALNAVGDDASAGASKIIETLDVDKVLSEQQRVLAQEEQLESSFDSEAQKVQKVIGEERDVVKNVLESALEEEKHDIEAELLKSRETLQDAAAAVQKAIDADGSPSIAIDGQVGADLLPQPGQQPTTANDTSPASSFFGATPRMDVRTLGLLSAGFLLLGVVSAYFLRIRYRRLVARKKRRGSADVRRKRWQRPIESSDLGDFAEEVVLLPSSENGSEPEPEVLEYLPRRLTVNVVEESQVVSRTEETDDSDATMRTAQSQTVRLVERVETIPTEVGATSMDSATIETRVETTTVESSTIDVMHMETTPMRVRRSRRATTSAIILPP